MNRNHNKQDVCKIYDQISDWFDKNRSRELLESKWIDKASIFLPENASVLDLGCGMGEPIIPYLLNKSYIVTGVDGSAKLIELARLRYPEVEFILSDMRELNISKKFDLVIAWHSLFHLPKEDQRLMFKAIASYLKKGGVFLFTSGRENGEVWSDNGGEHLYHASFSLDEYDSLLKQAGFSVIEYIQSDSECGDATIWLTSLK